MHGYSLTVNIAIRDRSLNMARGGGGGGGVFGFFPTKGLFLVIYYEQPKEMHKMPFKLEHWVLT
jgi:hypothetical protein